MKLRTGFVSNSSSSSFVVAIPNIVTECKCCRRDDRFILEAITKYMGSLKQKEDNLYAMDSKESITEFYRERLNKLVSAVEYYNKELIELEKLMEEPELLDKFFELKHHYDCSLKPEYFDVEPDGCDLRVREPLENRVNKIKKFIVDGEVLVKDLLDKISTMENFIDLGYTVYSFTLDNWCSDAHRQLKQMMQDGVVIKLIEQVNS